MGTIISVFQLRALDRLIARKRELQQQIATGDAYEVAQAERDLKLLNARGNGFSEYRNAQ